MKTTLETSEVQGDDSDGLLRTLRRGGHSENSQFKQRMEAIINMQQTIEEHLEREKYTRNECSFIYCFQATKSRACSEDTCIDGYTFFTRFE